MQLEGTLAVIPLGELIEMIVYSSVAGALEIQVGDQTGRIFFRDGQPYDADVDLLTGIDAVGFLFTIREGAFQFIAGLASDAQTIWADPLDLIERAMADAQHWSAVRATVPSMMWVPVPRNEPPEDAFAPGDTAWRVLGAIDGAANVADIAAVCGVGPLDTCQALHELIVRRAVAIRPPAAQRSVAPSPLPAESLPRHAAAASSTTPSRPASAPQAEPSAVTPPPGDSFFERFIATTLADEEIRRQSEPNQE